MSYFKNQQDTNICLNFLKVTGLPETELIINASKPFLILGAAGQVGIGSGGEFMGGTIPETWFAEMCLPIDNYNIPYHEIFLAMLEASVNGTDSEEFVLFEGERVLDDLFKDHRAEINISRFITPAILIKNFWKELNEVGEEKPLKSFLEFAEKIKSLSNQRFFLPPGEYTFNGLKPGLHDLGEEQATGEDGTGWASSLFTFGQPNASVPTTGDIESVRMWLADINGNVLLGSATEAYTALGANALPNWAGSGGSPAPNLHNWINQEFTANPLWGSPMVSKIPGAGIKDGSTPYGWGVIVASNTLEIISSNDFLFGLAIAPQPKFFHIAFDGAPGTGWSSYYSVLGEIIGAYQTPPDAPFMFAVLELDDYE